MREERSSCSAESPQEQQWHADGIDLFDVVDEEVIADVLANWTGIPVYKLTEEETSKLLRMEEELHKRIIGQDRKSPSRGVQHAAQVLEAQGLSVELTKAAKCLVVVKGFEPTMGARPQLSQILACANLS